jgi:hypothetical protein
VAWRAALACVCVCATLRACLALRLACACACAWPACGAAHASLAHPLRCALRLAPCHHALRGPGQALACLRALPCPCVRAASVNLACPLRALPLPCLASQHGACAPLRLALAQGRTPCPCLALPRRTPQTRSQSQTTAPTRPNRASLGIGVACCLARLLVCGCVARLVALRCGLAVCLLGQRPGSASVRLLWGLALLGRSPSLSPCFAWPGRARLGVRVLALRVVSASTGRRRVARPFRPCWVPCQRGCVPRRLGRFRSFVASCVRRS